MDIITSLSIAIVVVVIIAFFIVPLIIHDDGYGDY